MSEEKAVYEFKEKDGYSFKVFITTIGSIKTITTKDINFVLQLKELFGNKVTVTIIVDEM